MMLTKRYMVAQKNIPGILGKIIDGTAPERFTIEHLKNIGFGSSNDRGIIPMLKDLGFLDNDGTPTPRYHSYRDTTKSRKVLGEAVRQSYSDLFHIRENPTPADREAIEGVFRSTHNSTEKVAQLQAATFLSFLKESDLPKDDDSVEPAIVEDVTIADIPRNGEIPLTSVPMPIGLHYTIQVHLPATKDIEVFNAIFRSMREQLLT